MAEASFDTPDGDDVTIDPESVSQLRAGEEEGTAVIELDDGSEVVVVATLLEVAAELGLDPLDYISSDDDVSLTELIAGAELDEED
jgi:hypothetical protein